MVPKAGDAAKNAIDLTHETTSTLITDEQRLLDALIGTTNEDVGAIQEGTAPSRQPEHRPPTAQPPPPLNTAKTTTTTKAHPFIQWQPPLTAHQASTSRPPPPSPSRPQMPPPTFNSTAQKTQLTISDTQILAAYEAKHGKPFNPFELTAEETAKGPMPVSAFGEYGEFTADSKDPFDSPKWFKAEREVFIEIAEQLRWQGEWLS